MKKLGIIALGIAMSAVFAFTAPTTVKAEGMPCTEAELQKAEAQMASAQAEVAKCAYAKALADWNFQLVMASNPSDLDKTIAYDNMVNKNNQLDYARSLVYNAQLYIDAVKSRARSEQIELDMRVKWANRAEIDRAKLNADNAQDIANSAKASVDNIARELAGVDQSNPGLANVYNILNTALVNAQADYAAKQLRANELKAIYEYEINNLNWATNEDQANYDFYVRSCIEASREFAEKNDLKVPTDHDIMHWYD